MNNTNKTKRMVELSILTAIVVVLQFISYVVKIGTFPLSLVHIPIIIAAILYGPGQSAYLGGVFGAVVIIGCITGTDAGGAMVWNANPAMCFAVCMLKGILAGLCSGLVYKALKNLSAVAASLLAAIVSPVVNTLTFCVCMLVFFKDVLNAWAGGNDLLTYTIVGLVGINFLIELGINVIFAPTVSRIIKAVNK